MSRSAHHDGSEKTTARGASPRRAPDAGERSYRVLVIEDDPVAASQLELTLRRAVALRFDTQIVPCLREAVRALERRPFDVIALDLSLPDASGSDAFEQMKAHACDIPIVVVSGRDDDELALRLIQEGAQDYVVKHEQSWRNTARCFEHALERHRVERELIVAREAAEKASHAKSLFIASMSHELRTPLHAILGMADVLLESRLDEDQREYVQLSQRAGRILLELLNNALELSRLESERFQLDRRAFTLRQWLDDTLDLFAFRAHRKGLQLAADVGPRVPDAVVGDRARLRQILINLIGNAIKFTDQGGVLVRVGCGETRPHRARLCIEVVDTGPGIPEDRRSAIFERFIQAEPGTASHYGGSGLGLALCRELTERMGGTLEAFNRNGRGSAFRLSIELERDAASREDAAPATPLAGKRVLLADDGEIERSVLVRAMRYAGAQVVEATSLNEAHRALAQGEAGFDRIVLDTRMPDGGGLDLAEELHRTGGADPPVVVLLSRDHRLGDLSRCERAGLTPLVKPVRSSALVAALTEGSRSPSEPQRERGHAPGPSRLRLLVAEDSADNRALILAYLRNTGWTVRIAEDGHQAVEKCKAETFDIVLMDMSMPGLDGYEATRTIRSWERERGVDPIPIVALTAHALEGHERRALEAGCDGYLSKPVLRDTLLQTVAEHARPSRATGSAEEEIADLVPEFLSNRSADVDRLRRALDKADFRRVATLGHRMKGSGAGYGFAHISTIGAELERAALERDVVEIRRWTDDLEGFLKRTE